jgi:hypothetical protein
MNVDGGLRTECGQPEAIVAGANRIWGFFGPRRGTMRNFDSKKRHSSWRGLAMAAATLVAALGLNMTGAQEANALCPNSIDPNGQN